MANPTMTLIGSYTSDNSGPTAWAFTSIPQTYTDLKMVFSARTTNGGVFDLTYLFFNNNGSGYTLKQVFGTGSAAASTSPTAQSLYLNGTSTTSNTFTNSEVYIPNYTSSNYKSYSIDQVLENNSTTGYTSLQAGLWSNTSAITALTIIPSSSMPQYVTAYLYGISNS